MTEEVAPPSMAQEMAAESSRRQAARAEEAAEDKDLGGEPSDPDVLLDLDHTEQQRTAKIDMTEVADTLVANQGGRVKVADQQKDRDDGCGLPEDLMDRHRTVGYVKLHGITSKNRKDIEYTAYERDKWDRYQKIRPNQQVNKEFFVAALRLHKAGFPRSLEKKLDLNTMKVN